MSFDLVGMSVREKRKEQAITVLFREGGVWHGSEVGKLVEGLRTFASQHPQHPEYVLLAGEYSKEVTLAAIGGGVAYTAEVVMGMDNEALPFTPQFV
jgi:hypothetical protein